MGHLSFLLVVQLQDYLRKLEETYLEFTIYVTLLMLIL